MQRAGISFFLIALILTLLALLKLYAPFLMNLLIAFLLFIATQGIYSFLLKSLKSPIIASSVMLLCLIALCFIPLFYVFFALTNYATSLDLGNFQNFISDTQQSFTNALNQTLEYLPNSLQTELHTLIAQLHNQDWTHLTKRSLDILTQASKNGFYFLSDTFFILIFLFFFYFYSTTLGKYFLELIPLEQSQTKTLYNEVSSVIGVVFYSSILSMFLQGTLFGILMFYYGYNAFLLGIFYGFASLIPVVGGGLVWIPIAGYELYLGNYTNSAIIALYSVIIIATLADNGVKPFIIGFINRVFIKTPIKINEMLIFFAILAGLTSFGFWGIILGPAITALFIALLRIYQHYTLDQNPS